MCARAYNLHVTRALQQGRNTIFYLFYWRARTHTNTRRPYYIIFIAGRWRCTGLKRVQNRPDGVSRAIRRRRLSAGVTSSRRPKFCPRRVETVVVVVVVVKTRWRSVALRPFRLIRERTTSVFREFHREPSKLFWILSTARNASILRFSFVVCFRQLTRPKIIQIYRNPHVLLEYRRS